MTVLLGVITETTWDLWITATSLACRRRLQWNMLWHRKTGGNLRPLHQTQAFRDVLDEYSLQDLHGMGHFFTWVNRRTNNELIFERLDRFVGTFDWRILYPAARVQTLEFFSSDHRAILMELGLVSIPNYSPGSRFKFENHWATRYCRCSGSRVERRWRNNEDYNMYPEL